MKVIKDNYNKTSIMVTCNRCSSILEVEENDIFHDEINGLFCFKCPLCDYNSTTAGNIPYTWKKY